MKKIIVLQKKADRLNNKVYGNIFMLILMLAFVLTCFVTDSIGAEKNMTKCKMQFNLRGWSAIYQTASGTGAITCDNGQSANVKIDTKGGGLTAGKSRIEGTGTFSEVSDIAELFGAYAKAEAHAGIVKSAGAQVITKGEVSLALAGTGRGVDLGIAFGKFTIKQAGRKGGK